MAARAGLALLCLAGLCGLGCGGDPNAQQPVSGTVTFQGQPLDQGHILFVPATTGPSEAGAVIENGNYDIPQAHGLVPGQYKVRIFSYDQTGPKVDVNAIPGEPPNMQARERIPLEYNAETKLTAEIKAGRNRFEFKVE